MKRAVRKGGNWKGGNKMEEWNWVEGLYVENCGLPVLSLLRLRFAAGCDPVGFSSRCPIKPRLVVAAGSSKG